MVMDIQSEKRLEMRGKAKHVARPATIKMSGKAEAGI